MLHETEAWVFAAAQALGILTEDPSLAASLEAMARSAGGPELVNDGTDTAPSKRILGLFPQYQKTLHGPLAVEDLGLVALRDQCPHLDQWIRAIEDRGHRESAVPRYS